MQAWLTPSEATGSYACRLIRIPIELLPHVGGALGYLAQIWNWEEFGAMTREEAVTLCAQMIADYYSAGEVDMVGAILAYAGALPDGVLPCDGSQHLRASYPALYAVLDASLIVDADHFVTPDLRGRTVIGTGTGASLTPRAFGDTGGEETHQLTASEMPIHNHSLMTEGVESGYVGTVAGLVPLDNVPSVTGNAGGDGAHENMQPYSALNYGIVAYLPSVLCGGSDEPGSIKVWPTDAAPDGWLLCAGAAVSRTLYATLFGLIGITFGAGDGSTTFNLPDLRGRVPLGTDDMGGTPANRVTDAQADTVGGSGGEEKHQLTIAELAAHYHTNAKRTDVPASGGQEATRPTPGTASVTSTVGGDTPHNNMQPYLSLNYIIKT